MGIWRDKLDLTWWVRDKRLPTTSLKPFLGIPMLHYPHPSLTILAPTPLQPSWFVITPRFSNLPLFFSSSQSRDVDSHDNVLWSRIKLIDTWLCFQGRPRDSQLLNGTCQHASSKHDTVVYDHKGVTRNSRSSCNEQPTISREWKKYRKTSEAKHFLRPLIVYINHFSHPSNSIFHQQLPSHTTIIDC